MSCFLSLALRKPKSLPKHFTFFRCQTKHTIRRGAPKAAVNHLSKKMNMTNTSSASNIAHYCSLPTFVVFPSRPIPLARIKPIVNQNIPFPKAEPSVVSVPNKKPRIKQRPITDSAHSS
jgi:hypothetical protein